MMDRMIDNITLLYVGLKDSVISWLLLISVILVLMLIFRCFTSPMKIARKKLQFINENVKTILDKGKKDKEIEIPLSIYKKLERNTISAERLTLAYFYDNGDDLKAKTVMSLVNRIHNSLEATRTERVLQDQRALTVLMRNMAKQSEEGLKLLSEY